MSKRKSASKLSSGFEVKLEWLLNTIKYRDGKQLLKEVVGDTIIIYADKHY